MFKNEEGFSLVELAVAAAVAVALGAVAVTVLTGVASGISTDAQGAADASDAYNTSAIAAN